jgi:hypothetical protein
MIVHKTHVGNNTLSCHYCSRGRKSGTRPVLIFPYSHVYVFKGENGALMSAICPICVEELKKKVQDIDRKSSGIPKKQEEKNV